jgi:hypothetical protein
LPTAAGLADSVPAFAAGIALWALALLLIGIPRQFAPAVRLLGLVSAILSAVVAARIFGGEQLPNFLNWRKYVNWINAACPKVSTTMAEFVAWSGLLLAQRCATP